MSTTFKHARILAVPLAGFALIAAGLAAAPAQAAAKVTTVTIHVVDANGPVDLPTLSVGVGNKKSWVPFSQVEGSPGDYSGTSANKSGLAKGNWTIYAYDDRQEQPYANSMTPLKIVAGANRTKTVTLQVGAIVSGTVTAPSGHTLSGVMMTAEPTKHKSSNYGNQSEVDSEGAYRILGLQAGKYKIGYIVGYEYKQHTLAGTRTLTVGQLLTGVNVANVKVPAFIPDAVKGASTAKNEATLTVTGIGEFFSLTNPGGTVSVKDGKTLKKDVAVTDGDASISLTGLKKGKHKFTVSYSGSQDVNKGRVKVSVTVK